jgi:hypothetical protein
MLTQEREDSIHIDLAEDLSFPAEDSPAPTPPSPPQPPEAKKDRPWKRVLVWVAIALVLAMGGVALISYLGSQSQEKAVQGLPETPAIKVLDSTQAFFLENAHAGQIFVVEGEVENQSPKPVSFIMLEGKLFNTTNRVAITQKCFAGNFMSREELSRLNMTEIQNRMMNREGKALSNVKIPPMKRVPFVLVFHNLPELKALSDYSVEVVSSKLE